MKLNLEDIDKAPEKGCLLAYTREEVLFEQYKSKKEAIELLIGKEVLELHLFDKEKEYRILETRSKRYTDGKTKGKICREVKLTDLDKHKIFSEEILLEKSGAFKNNKINSIRVLNEVSYDDENIDACCNANNKERFGMAMITNYQLVWLEESKEGSILL